MTPHDQAEHLLLCGWYPAPLDRWQHPRRAVPHQSKNAEGQTVYTPPREAVPLAEAFTLQQAWERTHE